MKRVWESVSRNGLIVRTFLSAAKLERGEVCYITTAFRGLVRVADARSEHATLYSARAAASKLLVSSWQ